MKKKILTLLEAQKKMEHYCTYQERCHKEVVKKLQELDMIPISIDAIVSKLVEDNFLNETRFAQSYSRGKFRIKKWGKIRIQRELKARHLSDYNIKKGLEEIPDLDYNTTFWALFEKRKKEVYENIPSVQKKKIISYMVYKGWELEKIYEAIQQI